MAALVVKDNALIDASYSLTTVEQRLILLAIVHARETGKGITADSLLEIHASSYINQFGVEKHTAYEMLKNSVNTLFNRQFSYKDIDPKTGNTRHNKSRWVSKVAYVDDSATVQVIFAPDVVPLVTRLEECFTSYELQMVSDLSSAYAIRLYELLIRWRTTCKLSVSLEELRNQLGVDDGRYKAMKDFKLYVLDLAVKQLTDKTDIVVQYQQKKQGRTIVGFDFKYTFKAKQKADRSTTETKDKNTPDLFNGFTDKQIDLLVRSDLFLADFHQMYGSSDDYTAARFKLRKKLSEQPESFGVIDFERYK
jgi:plasmid replication initiation protein